MSEKDNERKAIVAFLRDTADHIELGNLTVTDFDRDVTYGGNNKRTSLLLRFERRMCDHA